MPPSPPPGANLLVLARDDSSWLLRLRRYDEDQVRLLKTLPERRWDAEAKGWIVPSGPHTTKVLQRQFPGVRLPTPSKGTPLERMRREMVVEGYSPKSRKVYLGHARRFLESAPRLAGLPDPEESGPGSQDDDLAWIDADLVRRYLEKQNAVKQISRPSANQILSAIRLLVRVVRARETEIHDIRRPRRSSTLPVVLSRAEAQRVVTAYRNPTRTAMLMLLYSAGLRMSELVGLKPEELDRDRGLVRVRAGKGRKDRYTLLSPKVAEAVDEHLAQWIFHDRSPEWLFPGQREGRHLTV